MHENMLQPLTIFVLAGLALIVVLAYREHAKQRQSRRGILEPCRHVLQDARVEYGGDGFPALQGYYRDRLVHAELIPDSMTIRRLPQLWLRLTWLESRPKVPEFAVLVRPAGTEFYSLVNHFRHELMPPSPLDGDVLVRASTPMAQPFLDIISQTIAKVLADPKVKELAVTRKGLRIVWQAAEGKRGEHLLMRQCAFDDAHVSAASFAELLSSLDDVSKALSGLDLEAAA